QGQHRDVRVARGAGTLRRRRSFGRPGRGGRMRVTVLTRRGDRDLEGPVGVLREAAASAGATLCMSADEAEKHGLRAGDGVDICTAPTDADLCIVLGGDGTILSALRTYAGTDIPVFAVNFGEVGFLATMDPDSVREGLDLDFKGE